jgi:hypothetical protein
LVQRSGFGSLEIIFGLIEKKNMKIISLFMKKKEIIIEFPSNWINKSEKFSNFKPNVFGFCIQKYKVLVGIKIKI